MTPITTELDLVRACNLLRKRGFLVKSDDMATIRRQLAGIAAAASAPPALVESTMRGYELVISAIGARGETRGHISHERTGEP